FVGADGLRLRALDAFVRLDYFGARPGRHLARRLGRGLRDGRGPALGGGDGVTGDFLLDLDGHDAFLGVVARPPRGRGGPGGLLWITSRRSWRGTRPCGPGPSSPPPSSPAPCGRRSSSPRPSSPRSSSWRPSSRAPCGPPPSWPPPCARRAWARRPCARPPSSPARGWRSSSPPSSPRACASAPPPPRAP